AGSDYSGVTASPLIIPAGLTSGTITGTLLDDGPPDAVKTLTFTLGTPTNATLGATTTNTLTIADPPPPPPPPPGVQGQANPARFPLGFGAGTNGVGAIVNLQANGQTIATPSPIPGFTGPITR